MITLSITSVPDGVGGVVFLREQLLAGCADGLDTVLVGLDLGLEVLVFLHFGLQVGRVL